MKIITFGTLKGGVGKTMLCFHLGGMLSKSGKKVLIIDSDLQGNLSNNIGIDRTSKGILTMYDIYNTDEKQAEPDKLIYKSPNMKLPELDIIPGSIFLHRAELKLAHVAGREQILSNYIEEHRGYFNKYEIILIDTNPSMSIINQNAFLASDSILLVSDVSMNSLEGAQLFIALWEETRMRLRVADNIRGFIINDYDSRNKISADFLEYVNTAEELSDIRAILLKTIIPRNVKITEAELAAEPIGLYDKNSKGSLAIMQLMDELKSKKII